jgi:hypothetical protein
MSRSGLPAPLTDFDSDDFDPNSTLLDPPVDLEALTATVRNPLFRPALEAHAALTVLLKSVMVGRLDFNSLNLDAADALVAEVEAFVRAYHKSIGDPVR